MIERLRSMWGLHRADENAQNRGAVLTAAGLCARLSVTRFCALSGLAVLLSGCGTTVDLTGSVDEPAQRSVRAIELTSSQQSLRLLSEQVTNTAWAERSYNDDVVGLFASVLVNGVKDADASPQQSQAALYLEEISQQHLTPEARLKAVRADLDNKVAQSEAFARAVDKVLTDYRLGAVAGTGQAGDVYRADLEQAALLREDVLAQARRDVRLVTKGFDALDAQRTVFSEALLLLGAETDAIGSLSADDGGAEKLLSGLDRSLVEIAALGASFDSLVSNSEAVVATVIQPAGVQP